MADLPADPFESPSLPFATELQHGRMAYEAVRRSHDFAEAHTQAQALSEDDLRDLAFYLAAKAVADSDREHFAGPKHWTYWWEGLYRLTPDLAPRFEDTVLGLWRLMQEHEDDDGFGTIHNPPSDD